MSISYKQNIPNPPNIPAQDVPNMQANTNAIFNFVGIDHVNFNTSGSGQHNKVTFNSNNVPTPPVSPPQLFTNTVNGLPQLFYYSGDANKSANQYVASSTGSTFLFGGIIMKWGSQSGSNSAIVTFNWATAFPNNAFSVSAITRGVAATIFVDGTNFTTSQLQVHVQATGSWTLYVTVIGN